jgi:DnaK suppressor protein
MKNQSVLSNTELEEIQQKLVTEQKEVSQRLAELKPQDPFMDPEHANDNASNDQDASEEEGHDRINAQIEELEARRADIEKALGKIEDGSYGICEVTGQNIPKERLLVFPTATTIVLPE